MTAAAVTIPLPGTRALFPEVTHEWHYDGNGRRLADDDVSRDVRDDAFIVCQCTRAHMDDTVQEQVKQLVLKMYMLREEELVPHVPLILKRYFDVPNSHDATSADKKPAFTHLQFVCAVGSDGSLIGFVVIVVTDSLEMILSSTMFTDVDLPGDVQNSVTRALFEVSEDILRELSVTIQKDASDADAAKQSAYRLVRSTLGVSDFAKAHMREHGYSVDFHDRLEMTIFLDQHDWTDLPMLSNNMTIEPLDIFADNLPQVYDVLNMAYGPSPPLFEAWKQHYAQQPRFAPELSFVAWDGDRVAGACCLERIADGHGGGDDEVIEVYTTSATLSTAAANSNQVDKAAAMAVQLPDDYSERCAEIVAVATSAYVCSVATEPAFRGRGIAHVLLRHCFAAAAQAGLKTVTLGTDRANPRAVSVYERSGMHVTKTQNAGNLMSREPDNCP